MSDLTQKDFFKAYRGRYSQYWVHRWGIIPNLPTSYDNSNDIYELCAWLQRAFKMLMDDFLNLELEFEEFKNAITEMLEILIPQIIREFIHSEEFKQFIFNLIDEWYKENLEQTINNILNDIKNMKEEINNLTNIVNNMGADLEKIIEKLKEIGVWGENGFIDGMGIAGGNINVFGGITDGGFYIRTNNRKSENDITVGI